ARVLPESVSVMSAAPRCAAQQAGAMSESETSRTFKKRDFSPHPAAVPAPAAARATWSARGADGSLAARQTSDRQRINSVELSKELPPRYSSNAARRTCCRTAKAVLNEPPCVGNGLPRN